MAGLFDLLSTGAVGQAVSSKRREQEEQMNTFKQVANRSAELQQKANAELSLMKKKSDLAFEIEKEQAPYFDAKREKIAGEKFDAMTKEVGFKYKMGSISNLEKGFENTQKALENLEVQNAGIGSKLKTIDNQIALYTDMAMKNTDATIKGNAEMSIIKLRGEKDNLLAQQSMNNLGIGQTKNKLLKTYERLQNTRKIATRSYGIDLGTSFIEKPTFQQKIFGGSKPKELTVDERFKKIGSGEKVVLKDTVTGEIVTGEQVDNLIVENIINNPNLNRKQKIDTAKTTNKPEVVKKVVAITEEQVKQESNIIYDKANPPSIMSLPVNVIDRVDKFMERYGVKDYKDEPQFSRILGGM